MKDAGFSTLELVPTLRPFVGRSDGCYKTERHFLDFVVDGKSLYQIVQAKELDNISAFWLGTADSVRAAAAESAKRLMLMLPSDFPNNRRSLFICPECGQLGCGALSIVVESTNDGFIWQDFGYENDWEQRVSLCEFRDLGPFTFRSGHYLKTLNEAMNILNGKS